MPFSLSKAPAALKPDTTIYRRFAGCFQIMGAQTREPDNRTAKQLASTIEGYSHQLPEIEAFKSDIQALPLKHKGILADVFELSAYTEMLPTNINLRELTVNGEKFLPKIVDELIKSSKNNPEGIEFLGKVINNTDTITSKYFLYAASGGVLNNKNIIPQLKSTGEVLPQIAEESLKGGYTMDYSKQKTFLNYIKLFLDSDILPEKIKYVMKVLPEALDKIDSKRNLNVYIDTFVKSDTPISQIDENLNVMSEILSKSDGVQNFDVTKFLTKNINLK